MVVLPEALASLKNIVSELKLSQGTLTLDKATITEVKTVGLGHRVCVDTLTLMERGQGMLVGNSSAFTFLTHAETEHNEYVAARPFRINAGGVGKVNFLHIPSGPWVRFDTFLYQGYEVPPFYDSMLGKMIVFSSTREEAIRKMQSALCELVIGGLPNNIEDQIDIIRDPVFHSGDYYTDFIKNREG